MSQRWVMIPLAVFLAIAGLFAFALTGDGPSLLPSQLIGKPAPKYEFAPLDGLQNEGGPVKGFGAEQLASGAPVLVNFWASWCAPCIAEHPLLVQLKSTTNVAILGVNYKDDVANARRFLGRFENPYAAVGVDPTGRGAIEWGVAKMPETFLLNGNGEIIFKQSGPLTQDVVTHELVPRINALKQARQP